MPPQTALGCKSSSLAFHDRSGPVVRSVMSLGVFLGVKLI